MSRISDERFNAYCTMVQKDLGDEVYRVFRKECDEKSDLTESDVKAALAKAKGQCTVTGERRLSFHRRFCS